MAISLTPVAGEIARTGATSELLFDDIAEDAIVGVTPAIDSPAGPSVASWRR